MYRLFVALDFPETIQEQLLELYQYGIPGASWVDYEQLHLTLRFIGEVDGVQFSDIRESLAEIEVSSFSLTLKGVGFFPPRKTPRILWVGVAANDELLQLQKKIERRLVAVGISPEKRKFTPHITLARLKNTPEDRVGKFLMGNSLFQSDTFSINEFVLYSSVLSSKGATHHKEMIYSF